VSLRWTTTQTWLGTIRTTSPTVGFQLVRERSSTPCSSLIRSTVTSGRSRRAPKPGSPIGSRPSAFVPASTTACPGTYVYNDRTTALLEACEWEECALTVLATVVSTSVPGQAVVDAGAKALGREPLRAEGDGFGVLLDHPEVRVTRMSEEHGILDLGESSWRPSVGEVVRVVPNHVCVAVHLQAVMYGIRGGRLEHEWPIAARGRAPMA